MSSQIANELRKNTTAVRLHFSWMGTRKTLESHQRVKAANTFGADANYLSASQKILDSRHPAFAKLTRIKNEAVAYWKAHTLPYTEDGVRLLHKDKVEVFSDRMKELHTQFMDAVQVLDNNLWELKADAKKRLGSLYNDAHYPDTVEGNFGMEWDFPSIEPPEYLAKLAPSVYEHEKERIQQRLTEAVQIAEAAFISEFKDLVESLHERLTPDGTKKTFKDSTIKNLGEFFAKFKDLNLGSNNDLDCLVSKAEDLLKGIKAEELRDLPLLRKEVNEGLAGIKDKLTNLVVNAPRRKIIKPKEPTNAVQEKEPAAEAISA